VISPPFPIADKKPLNICYCGWSGYTAKHYLEKVEYIYSAALKEYMNLVDSLLVNLRDSLRIAQLSPCKFVGGLEFSEETSENRKDFNKAVPTMTWYFEALPSQAESCVDIQLKAISMQEKGLIERIAKNNVRLRPEKISLYTAIITSQVLRIETNTPTTDIVYRWLEDDLTRIGWLR
jgi:hypothetical protein